MVTKTELPSIGGIYGTDLTSVFSHAPNSVTKNAVARRVDHCRVAFQESSERFGVLSVNPLFEESLVAEGHVSMLPHGRFAFCYRLLYLSRGGCSSQLGSCRRNAGTREARSPAPPFPPAKGCFPLPPAPRLSPTTLLAPLEVLPRRGLIARTRVQGRRRKEVGGKPCLTQPSRRACRRSF